MGHFLGFELFEARPQTCGSLARVLSKPIRLPAQPRVGRQKQILRNFRVGIIDTAHQCQFSWLSTTTESCTGQHQVILRGITPPLSGYSMVYLLPPR